MDFIEIHRRTVAWAERECARICDEGEMLAALGLQIAKCVGVRSPERIRVMFVPSVPFPDDLELKALARSLGLVAENTGGMTLSYGVFIREDCCKNEKLLAHELRHVTQYEASGSISVFMDHYLRELLHYGYGPGPFEVDADIASLRYK